MAEFETQPCPKCGDPVIIAALRTGGTVTVDAEPVRAGGTIRLTDRGGMQPLAELPSTVARFGARLRHPHVDTCGTKAVAS